MHGVYILGSKKDKKLYIGSSCDIKARLAKHNAGKVAATKSRRPLVLLYCELHGNRSDAMHREVYLKTGWGMAYLRRTIPETLKIFSSKI